MSRRNYPIGSWKTGFGRRPRPTERDRPTWGRTGGNSGELEPRGTLAPASRPCQRENRGEGGRETDKGSRRRRGRPQTVRGSRSGGSVALGSYDPAGRSRTNDASPRGSDDLEIRVNLALHTRSNGDTLLYARRHPPRLDASGVRHHAVVGGSSARPASETRPTGRISSPTSPSLVRTFPPARSSCSKCAPTSTPGGSRAAAGRPGGAGAQTGGGGSGWSHT